MSRKARDAWIRRGAAIPLPDPKTFIGPLMPLDAEDQALLDREIEAHGEEYAANLALVRTLAGAWRPAEPMGDDPMMARAFPFALEGTGRGDPMAVLAAIALSKLDAGRRKKSLPPDSSRSRYDAGEGAGMKDYALRRAAELRAAGTPDRALIKRLQADIEEAFAFRSDAPSDRTLRRWLMR